VDPPLKTVYSIPKRFSMKPDELREQTPEDQPAFPEEGVEGEEKIISQLRFTFN
jgi:hypothetical protein